MVTTRYIALLRGINVGGNNLIKMAALRECLENAGFDGVRTYIASGNVLFDCTDEPKKVEVTINTALDKAFGYKGPTVILSTKDYKVIMKEAPRDFGAQPDTLHSDVMFLKPPAQPEQVLEDILALKIREGVDAAVAGSKAVYFTRVSELRTRSRMGKITELASYKSMTIRSWNTAKKLESLLES